MSAKTESGQERRERNRTKVNWRGKLMTARGSFDCRVLDLSPGGALVRLIAALEVNEPVTLFFAEAESVKATVAWTQSRYVGLRFATRRERPIPDVVSTEDHPAAAGPQRASALAIPISTPPKPAPPGPTPAAAKPAGTIIDGGTRFTGSRLDRNRPSFIASQIQPALMERMDIEQATRMSREVLIRELEPLVVEVMAERNLQVNMLERTAVIRHLVDDMIGFGPLEPLLADETVSDILVHGPHRVYVERAGKLGG